MNGRNIGIEEPTDDSHLLKVESLVPGDSGPDNEDEFIKAIQLTEVLPSAKQEGEKFQQYLCTIIACIGALAVGGNSAWTSPGLPFLASSNSSAPFLLKNSQEGTLGSLFELFYIMGHLVVYLLGMSKSYLVLCYSMTAISIIVFFSLNVVPESPTYLVKKKRFRRAEKVLRKLRGSNYNVSIELDDIQSYLQYLDRPKVSKSVVYSRVKIKALFICCGLMLFQQLSGNGAVIYFADMIFISSGASNSSLCAIIMSSAQVIATVATVALVDRTGRKILLYISSATTGLCMLALGFYFWMQDNVKDTSHISWLPLGSLVIYIIGYSFGLGPISWLMSVEVLDPEIRSLGATVTAATCLILVTLVTFFFQPVTQLITTAFTFWLFAFFCGLSILFVRTILPETKGIPIQEVQILLAKKKIKPLD